MSDAALTLEKRIRRLEDIEEFPSLKSRYHLYIDDTRFSDIAPLFTEDAYVHLGYLMPKGLPVIGRSNIDAGFQAMKTSTTQSQVKQLLHNHIVELTSDSAARGTSLLEAFYGVKDESFIVVGRYTEDYVRIDERWFFKSMQLSLYFTVPLKEGWAGHKRHYLVNSGETIAEYKDLVPNPPV